MVTYAAIPLSKTNPLNIYIEFISFHYIRSIMQWTSGASNRAHLLQRIQRASLGFA